MHGEGTYTWPNKQRYTGQWKEGKMHGKGTLYDLNGKVHQEGTFKDGEFTGK